MAQNINVGRRRPVHAKPVAKPKSHAKPKLSLLPGKNKGPKIKTKATSKHAKPHLIGTSHQVKKDVAVDENASLNIKDKALLVREQLKGPAKLIGDNELNMLVKMDTSIDYIQKRMQSRVMVSVISVLAMTVAGFFIKGSFAILFGMGFVVAGLTWFMDQKKTLDFYRKFQLRRQIAFSQFTRLAAAYLPELKEGTNLYSVFAKIVPRMGDERDTAALQKLMIDMQRNPDDSGPFLTFAHEFSVSDRAELIMLTIQQMYRGDVEDENIRALADGANEDMIKQCDTIIAFKLARFNNLTARIGICAMIPIIGYFGLLVKSTVLDSLGQLTAGAAH